MELNLEGIRKNVKKSTTEDLLDRVTVYRGDMEPAALLIIEAELADRGITVEQIESHLRDRRDVLTNQDGSVVKCSFCYKPAVDQGLGWHWLFDRIPLFLRRYSWCSEHLPPHRRAKGG